MRTAYGVGSAAQLALEEMETKREEKYSGGQEEGRFCLCCAGQKHSEQACHALLPFIILLGI